MVCPNVEQNDSEIIKLLLFKSTNHPKAQATIMTPSKKLASNKHHKGRLLRRMTSTQ